MRHPRLSLVILLLLLAPLRTPAQDGTPESEAPDDLFRSTILDDLFSSDLGELLDWARTLGLDTGGDRRSVEDRILEAYGFGRAELEAERSAGAPEERGETGSLLRIERARGSEFFTLEATDEEYLRLTGGVQLTLEDGETVHSIEAREIIMNLTRNTLTAQGAVRYTTQREDSREEFRGDTIVFAIDSWEGVFIHGITETRNVSDEGAAGETEFSVAGERITRSADEIIVIDGGEITSSRADPPNYSIRARRIWVLAPGEWGLRGATLHVGRVPMFYLPVFFLPGDRLFFNPAVGTRTREGTYIQTSTYIFGQSEERDPPISVMRLAEAPDDAERVIDGLFLRIPDEPRPPDPPGWSLKFMLDAYTALGGYTGVDASFPDLGPFRSLDLRLGIGVSRALYFRNGVYSPWYIDANGAAQQYWNSGWFLGRRTPFRHEGELDAALGVGALSVNLSMLSLSDPEFRRDFGNRRESMDWNFILSSDEDEEPEGNTTVPSTVWEANASFRPALPAAIQPWVNSFSVTRFRSRLDLRSRDAEGLPAPLTRSDIADPPEARFFYPESVVLPDVGLRIAGTLFSSDRSVASRAGSNAADPGAGDTTPEAEDDEAGNGTELRPPWETEPENEPAEPGAFRLPEPADDLAGVPDGGRPSVQLGYSLEPGLRYDRFTDNQAWSLPEDVSIRWRYSTLQSRTRAATELSMRDGAGYLALRSSLALDYRFQDLRPEVALTEQEEESLRRAAFAYRQTRIDQRNRLTLRPLINEPAFTASSLAYTLDARLYDRSFVALNTDGSADFAERWPEWTRDGITTHQGEATLVWDGWGAQQRLSTRAELPPRLRSHTGTLTLVTGPLTSSVTGGYREEADEQWTPDPLQQRHELVALNENLRLSQQLDYDLDRVELTRARTQLDLWPVSLAVQGRRTGSFNFVDGRGWEAADVPERFRWTNADLSVDAERRIRTWRRRIDLSLIADLRLQADLQRFTNSSLSLDYGIRFDIYRFLELEISARTSNALLYQYIPSLAARTNRPARSLGEDIADSLRLLDREARERAGFKLDSLNVSAVHDLQDWDLFVTYTGRPELERESTPQRYRWRSLLTLELRWRAISELERRIELEDGEVSFGDGAGQSSDNP